MEKIETQVKKIIKYPKTAQYRTVIKDISERISFVGLDEDGNAIFDHSIKKPVLKFKGTVKIHGTNAGVSYNSEHGMWAQSKNDIITPEKDNFAFAFFAHSNEDFFSSAIKEFANNNGIDLSVYTVTVYGEWAGEGVQKGMGISHEPKSFFVFGVKVSKPGDEDFKSFWVDASEFPRDEDNRIYHVDDFGVFEIDIDFNMPGLVINELADMTIEVENECPVAKKLGHIGIGEGIVWSVVFKDETYRFKVKGEKHSATKVKKLVKVDVEKLNSIKEFVEYAMTENRFEQALQTVFVEEDIDVKRMGDFIRWCINDITSEEMDTMVENGLEPKDVNKHISAKAREMFFIKYNEF